ncbi:TPA: hypothetical protein ACQFKW_002797 [Proteus mirabilis]|uniref:hypothetical protein n=1 Tax=Proteus mirabilis TaxID=584 RepID=UPI00254E6F0A|nr:hypothetical protein [Proteus mirabilis]MDK7001996.1 hypothetical protein [Proteus mirabilis]MDK7019900.1 hypothetical protein [Proteus mirabilis]MDK8621712.1 hypothetical protein [Proteus mirabilis]
MDIVSLAGNTGSIVSGIGAIVTACIAYKALQSWKYQNISNAKVMWKKNITDYLFAMKFFEKRDESSLVKENAETELHNKLKECISSWAYLLATLEEKPRELYKFKKRYEASFTDFLFAHEKYFSGEINFMKMMIYINKLNG